MALLVLLTVASAYAREDTHHAKEVSVAGVNSDVDTSGVDGIIDHQEVEVQIPPRNTYCLRKDVTSFMYSSHTENSYNYNEQHIVQHNDPHGLW